MTKDQSAPIFESWLKGTDVAPPDAHQSAREVAGRLPQIRQRGRWWPLPSFPPSSTPAQGIPATDGYASTVTASTMPAFSVTRFVAAGVIVALFGAVLLIAQPFAQQGASVPGASSGGPGTFSPAGSLAQGRAEHTATLLPDGRVLVVGGDTTSGSTAAAEVWDPATETFSPAGSLAEGSAEPAGTRLPDGRILMVGPSSARLWDPETPDATGFAADRAGLLTDRPRQFSSATLLQDGRVLVVGGYKKASAEIWDPATTSFSRTGSLAHWRDSHTATLLPDGRVLVVGGSCPPTPECLAHIPVAEVWDPQTATFEPAGSLAQGREDHTATLLPDGRVLVVGGFGSLRELASAEVWDPTTASFGPAGSLAEPRLGHTATFLPDGRVLVVGGVPSYGDSALASAEVWEPGDG